MDQELSTTSMYSSIAVQVPDAGMDAHCSPGTLTARMVATARSAIITLVPRWAWLSCPPPMPRWARLSRPVCAAKTTWRATVELLSLPMKRLIKGRKRLS
eukprot:scaffold106416_cov66-Phaeocystis_antarctica.AAC.2